MIKINNDYINIENLNFLVLQENNICIPIRKKIKTEYFQLNFTSDELDKVLKENKYKIVRLGKYYINLLKILAIQENIEDCELKKNIKIRFIFDSDYIEVEIARNYWDFWLTQMKTIIKN